MNRRGFFRTLAASAAGFTILPPATTYGRVWKATKFPFVIPPPIPFDPKLYMGEWSIIIGDGTPVIRELISNERKPRHVWSEMERAISFRPYDGMARNARIRAEGNAEAIAEDHSKACT